MQQRYGLEFWVFEKNRGLDIGGFHRGEPKPSFELDHLDQLVDVLEFLFFEFECDRVAGGAGGRGDKDLDF